MVSTPIEPTQEAKVASEHVETQYGKQGEQVLLLRVTSQQSPGRVTYDIVQAEPVRRVQEGLRTLGEARRLARAWIGGAL